MPERRASDETRGQAFVRRWVHARFRGGEKAVPNPQTPGLATNTLNTYLASSSAGRWFERWFWAFVCVAAFISAALSIGFMVTERSAPFWLIAFVPLVLVFALRIQAGVRCLFRHRKAPRRKRR